MDIKYFCSKNKNYTARTVKYKNAKIIFLKKYKIICIFMSSIKQKFNRGTFF